MSADCAIRKPAVSHHVLKALKPPSQLANTVWGMGGCYLCPVCYALHFLFAFIHSPHSGTSAEAIKCSLATTDYDKYTPEEAQEVQVFLFKSIFSCFAHCSLLFLLTCGPSWQRGLGGEWQEERWDKKSGRLGQTTRTRGPLGMVGSESS